MTELINPEPTIADLAVEFGPIPAYRICTNPPPGTGSVNDVVRLHAETGRLFELTRGTLLEKTMGTLESIIAATIVRILGNYVSENELGVVLGADGMLRLDENLVRIPDVSFVAKDRLPGGRIPDEAIARLVPNIAIEVISPSNSTEEMTTKLADYFRAGVDRVWYVYPRTSTIHVYETESNFTELTVQDLLKDHSTLPTFQVPVRDIFHY